MKSILIAGISTLLLAGCITASPRQGTTIPSHLAKMRHDDLQKVPGLGKVDLPHAHMLEGIPRPRDPTARAIFVGPVEGGYTKVVYIPGLAVTFIVTMRVNSDESPRQAVNTIRGNLVATGMTVPPSEGLIEIKKLGDSEAARISYYGQRVNEYTGETETVYGDVFAFHRNGDHDHYIILHAEFPQRSNTEAVRMMVWEYATLLGLI